jgi:hypothetical protein
VNFFNPSGSITAGSFGRVTNARSMRVIQLGGKWMF